MKTKLTPTALALFLCGVLSAATNKIAPDLRGFDPGSPVDIIIQYSGSPEPAKLTAIRAGGGRIRNTLEVIHALSATIPARMLRELELDKEIVHISPDRPVAPLLDYAEPTINANIAYANGYTGAGVGIAVIDSGISSHPDLNGLLIFSRIIYNQSFLPGNVGMSDLYGHGEMVAGILAGNASQSSGLFDTHTFRGIAPGANLVNLRVLDQNGSGTDSYVIAAIQKAIALKTTYNIRVINLSLGRPVYESYTVDPLCQAAEKAWQAGIVVVVAAGNGGRDNSQGTNGYGTITAPGNDPLVITVAR